MECGKPIKILQSRIKENNFCSRECGNRYKNRDKINTSDSTAYRRNAFLYYPHKCKICGWNKDERVLEQCRENFRLLEEGDSYCSELWKKFSDLSMIEFNKIYDKKFRTICCPEFFYFCDLKIIAVRKNFLA